MNAKLQVLIFTLVLLGSMVAVSEGYFGGNVGKKKRSNLVQVELCIYKTNLTTNRVLSS